MSIEVEELTSETEPNIKEHFSKMMASMLARFTVASTVYFIAICVLFSVALVRLNATETDLHGILVNQQIILNNQTEGQKDRTKLIKTISNHTIDFKTIIHALSDGVNK